MQKLCINKSKQGKVIAFDESKSGKTPANDKINTTITTDKIDQTPVGDIEVDPT